MQLWIGLHYIAKIVIPGPNVVVEEHPLVGQVGNFDVIACNQITHHFEQGRYVIFGFGYILRRLEAKFSQSSPYFHQRLFI